MIVTNADELFCLLNFVCLCLNSTGEHSNKVNRMLHFVGTTGSIIFFMLFLYTFSLSYLLLVPIFGYGCSWVGHFFFQVLYE